MRIRKTFAGVFAALVLGSGYLGLAPITIPTYGPYGQSDKGLHFIAFFLLSLTFYWIFETSRRRALNITIIVCTTVLGCGSEIAQGLIPVYLPQNLRPYPFADQFTAQNGRDFDPWDVLANVLGSLAGIALCAWYHRRMIERKRASKTYTAVPGDEETGGGGDVELQQGTGPQETGVTAPGQSERQANMDEELDNWDENMEDDMEEDEAGHANGTVHAKDSKTPTLPAEEVDRKKRDD